MSSIQMIMPKMGESIMEGTIIKWLKKEGDRINEDESILEIGTDKVDTEIPSIYKGKLKKILVLVTNNLPVNINYNIIYLLV